MSVCADGDENLWQNFLNIRIHIRFLAINRFYILRFVVIVFRYIREETITIHVSATCEAKEEEKLVIECASEYPVPSSQFSFHLILVLSNPNERDHNIHLRHKKSKVEFHLFANANSSNKPSTIITATRRFLETKRFTK